MPLPGQLASTRAGSPLSIASAVEQKIRYITDPRTGGRTIRTFHGSGPACQALVAGFEQNGWQTDLHGRSSGPEWELVCEIGYIWNNNAITDDPFDSWQLSSNRVEKDFLNAQNSLVASLTTIDRQILNGYTQNPIFPPPPASQAWNLADGSTFPLSSQGQAAYELILQDVSSQVIFQPVLTRTRLVSNIYSTKTSTVNSGNIIPTSSLTTILPTQLAFALADDPPYMIHGFLYGWLKNYPNVIVAAFNKTEIRQEYNFGLWSTSMYTFVTDGSV